MSFDTFKSLHLIFMVSWFAGLFYIVRLFIYHTESFSASESDGLILRRQFKVMEQKLWYIIAWPAMILTVVFGVSMLVSNPAFLKLPWMHVKLTFVVLLIAYHLYCHKLFLEFKQDKTRLTSAKLRVFNEFATLVLVAIMFIVVRKDSLNWLYATLVFFGVAVVLMIAIQWYKRFRARNA